MMGMVEELERAQLEVFTTHLQPVRYDHFRFSSFTIKTIIILLEECWCGVLCMWTAKG